MKERLSQMTFVLNVATTDSLIIKRYQIDSIKLKFDVSGEYYFLNGPKSFNTYEGQWDLSDDDEISYYVFKMNNGQIQKNRTLSLELPDGIIYFGTIRDPRIQITR